MPKVVDRDQRRAAIVAAARAVVSSDGIDAATMRRIADEAGCTTGRITHYFEGKHEVLVAVLREVHVAAATRMANRLSEPDRSARLRGVLEEALPLDRTRLDEWRVWLAFWGTAAGDPELEAEQQARYREWTALVAQLLDRPPDHPDVDRVTAIIDGIGIRATLDPKAFPPRRQKAAINQIVTAAR